MGLDFDRDRLYLGNFIPIMTAMFSREVFEKAGGFDESLNYYEDWDLWLRMVKYAVPQRLPGVSAEYRILRQRTEDDSELTQIVYRKHAEYWTIENLVRVWKRLDETQYQNRELRLLLDQIRIELNETRADLNECNKTWRARILRFMRRVKRSSR